MGAEVPAGGTPKHARNALLRQALESGVCGIDAARMFGISSVRVWQIAHRDGYGALYGKKTHAKRSGRPRLTRTAP